MHVKAYLQLWPNTCGSKKRCILYSLGKISGNCFQDSNLAMRKDKSNKISLCLLGVKGQSLANFVNMLIVIAYSICQKGAVSKNPDQLVEVSAEVSASFAEVSRKFLRVSRKFLRVSRKFLRVSRKFLRFTRRNFRGSLTKICTKFRINFFET